MFLLKINYLCRNIAPSLPHRKRLWGVLSRPEIGCIALILVAGWLDNLDLS